MHRLREMDAFGRPLEPKQKDTLAVLLGRLRESAAKRVWMWGAWANAVHLADRMWGAPPS